MRPFAGPPLPRLEQRDALRRAAACERPHAAQRKNVGPTALSILCLVRNCVELLPAAPLPPARCVYSVGRSSLSAACTCEGAHVSHRRRWHPCAPRSRVLRVLGSLTLLCARSDSSAQRLLQASTAQRRCSAKRVIRAFLHETQLRGRANSSQQPTACRSLARRFRGLCFVGSRVSAAGTWRHAVG